MKHKKSLTTEEVADLLGLPLVTIQRWQHQGKIPSRIVKHEKSFRRKDILDWAIEHDFAIKSDVAHTEPNTNDILYSAIQRAGIYYDIGGNDIVEVFDNSLQQLPFLTGLKRKDLLQQLLKREELASTGLGQGIAIPHTRERLQIDNDLIYVPIIFLQEPIEFSAIDGNLVFVLFMIFTQNTKDHLMVLSRISHALKDPRVIQILNERNKKNNLSDQILKIEQKIHK